MNGCRNLAVAWVLVIAVAAAMAACGSNGDEASAGGNGGNGRDGGGDGAYGGSAASSGTGGGGGMLNTDSGLSDGSSAADGFEPDAACATSTVTATLTPASLVFLIDRTGSMNCNPPPTQTTQQCEANPTKQDTSMLSKWEITRDAMTAAWQGMVHVDPLPSVGVMLFNSNDYCGFPRSPDVAVAGMSESQLSTLVSTLQGVKPKGDTPIVGSTISAYQFVKDNAASLPGNRFVVLLTDGAETCDVPHKDLLVEYAQRATWIGIRTFVLGAPGSETERAFLSKIAFAGGTASNPGCDHSGSAPDVGDCHMDMTQPGMNFAEELQKNLAAISGEALSCEFPVPKPEPGMPAVDPSKVNVKYTSGNGDETRFPQDTTKSCDNVGNVGWQYADETNQKIVLCGRACETVKSDPGASISIELGCQTEQVPK